MMMSNLSRLVSYSLAARLNNGILSRTGTDDLRIASAAFCPPELQGWIRARRADLILPLLCVRLVS